MKSRIAFLLCMLLAVGVFVAAADKASSQGTTKASTTKKSAKKKRASEKGKETQAKFDPRRHLDKESAETVVGNRGERDRDPDNSPAIEAYKLRAYPADSIPLQLSVTAGKAFQAVKSNPLINAGRPVVWQPVGPSTANMPDELTFSGAPYTTSGRVTALAIDPACTPSFCRAWVGAAGGGVWRTNNVFGASIGGGGGSVYWSFVSGSFATNAIGTLTYAGGVLYAGTGEPNASGDSESGLGIYRSTDGGTTWTHLASQVTNLTTTGNGTYTGDAFAGRSISMIVVDPTNANHLYVASARGVRGISSESGGATSNPPTPRPPFGVFESTDGGANFNFIWNGNASVRGVTTIALDPSWDGVNNRTMYAGVFASGAAGSGGVWRSTDGGANWTQIKAAINAARNTDRTDLAVTKLPNGTTRIYVGEGTDLDSSTNRARFWRTDDAQAAVPVFTDLTTSQNIGYCTSQCWYDNVVYSPPGKPDVVYLGGSYSYGTYGFSTNGRAFIRSADAGVTFTDQTWDATTTPTAPDSCCQPNPVAPNGQHPDSHAIVEIPGTDAAIYGGDGGLMRSSGAFANISSQCSGRGLGATSLALCQQLLSSVPTQLYSLNSSLSTLQFQSLSTDGAGHLQGGTQDNGTWGNTSNPSVWNQVIYGDGGQSGFNRNNSALRFNTFTGQAHDANFQNGNTLKWVVIGGPIASSPEGALFYPPIIADPTSAYAGSIFEGSQSVWRTQDWGGDQTYLETNCSEFTASSANPACGDFVQIGPAGATDLTASAGDYRGTTRSAGNVQKIRRTAADTGTMWVGTTTGRVFLTKNANDPAGSVTYVRLDNLGSASASPGRAVTGIAIDPANPNHAWISYNGYNFNTASQPGHVFSVLYDPIANDATWTRIDDGVGPLGDIPATDIAYDEVKGDLYVSSDFGVMRLPNSSTSWIVAGAGLPMVEVPGLTIVPSTRKLYAATHGRSAWVLNLQ